MSRKVAVPESPNDRSPRRAADGAARPGLDRPEPRKRPKDRADRILAAAAQLFRERGYHAVGIDDIGEAVGITGPAVYRHFHSKEALLVAAAERSIERFTMAYREAVAAPTPYERVAELVRVSIAGTIDDRDLTAVYLREGRHITDEQFEPMRVMLRGNRRLWIDALVDIRPELTPEQAGFMVQSIVGLSRSMVYFPRPSLSRARWEEVLTRMGVAAVLTRPGRAVGRDGKSASAIAGLVGRRAPQWPIVMEAIEPVAGSAGTESAIYRGSRREAILAVAVHLFRKHGYGGVGIDDIGAAAGITGPGVYRHFENKEDLLAAAFNRAGEQLAASVGRAFDGARTPREALERLIASYVEIAIENNDLISVWMTESHGLAPERVAEFRRSQRAYVDDWVGVVGDLRPELPEPEKRTMVQGALGIINGYTLVPARLPLEEVRPILVTMAAAALNA